VVSLTKLEQDMRWREIFCFSFVIALEIFLTYVQLQLVYTMHILHTKRAIRLPGSLISP
jgi:hypothetical protein